MTVAILILLGVAAIGALLMWRLWTSTKKLYQANDHEIPLSSKVAMIVVTISVLAPPLLTIILMIAYA